jgi:hypothetical protein
LQPLPFLLPPVVLDPRTLLENLDLGLDRRRPLRMLALGLVQRRLGLGRRLLAPFAIPLKPSRSANSGRCGETPRAETHRRRDRRQRIACPNGRAASRRACGGCVRLAPLATKLARRCNMSRRANPGRVVAHVRGSYVPRSEAADGLVHHSAASGINSTCSWRITPESGSNSPTHGERRSTALVCA